MRREVVPLNRIWKVHDDARNGSDEKDWCHRGRRPDYRPSRRMSRAYARTDLRSFKRSQDCIRIFSEATRNAEEIWASFCQQRKEYRYYPILHVVIERVNDIVTGTHKIVAWDNILNWYVLFNFLWVKLRIIFLSGSLSDTYPTNKIDC